MEITDKLYEDLKDGIIGKMGIVQAYEVAFKVLEVNYKDSLESVLSSLNGKLGQ